MNDQPSSSTVIVILVAFVIGLSVLFLIAQGERERKAAEETAAGIGEREHYGCFQYGEDEYCEVWVKTNVGWTLCYRTVPKSIPVEDILCHG